MARETKQLTTKQVNEAFDALRKEVVTGNDEHMLGYLDDIAEIAANARRVHGVFRRWSHRNHMLIEAQRRRLRESHKGIYAGVKQWTKLDRAVRDDAQPKTIWAFTGRRDEDDQAVTPGTVTVTNGNTPGVTPRARRGMGFIRVTVFDWTDTISTNPDFVEPNWEAPLAVGDRDILADLAASSPVPVHFVDIAARNENGWLNADGITVDSSQPIGNQISTLAHELVHYHSGHLDTIEATDDRKKVDDDGNTERDIVRARCEQEAGLGQWLVMKMLGLDEEVGNDVGAAAATYLRSWIDPDTAEEIAGHKRRLKLLNTRLDAAMRAATAVVDGYLAVTEGAANVAENHDTVIDTTESLAHA